MKKVKKSIIAFAVLGTMIAGLLGCGSLNEQKENNDNILSDNIVITETGEVLEKENDLIVPIEPTTAPENVTEPEAEPTATPEVVDSEVVIKEPEQEQVITEEDQVVSTGNELQLVFLGDSIFDNNRDGTGIPYLTSVECKADVYNLAIGGTTASAEYDEKQDNERWTSRGLVGIVKAITGEIPTDIFEGTRTKEILDSTDADFSKTDYFIIEYGMNDFLRAAPLNNMDNYYDLRTYVGALRYAITNLRNYAPDATIILCGPNYAQFFHEDKFIGDGNTLNTGYGTLFDYKGTCEYVANEQQAVFFDAYLGLGINGYTAEEYLEDGVHLTEKGRKLYASELARRILEIEETKNN